MRTRANAAFLTPARFTAALFAAGLIAFAPRVTASEALAKKYSCTVCHQADKKLVGPSWQDVSTKYSDGKVTPAQLAASIKKGSTGKWGSVPMPAQSQVPDADLTALATWVLQGGKP